MSLLAAFLSGLIFSCGLIVSGMVNPQKVLGFLDVFGDWDASLAFVMAWAVVVAAIGYKWVLKRNSPIFTTTFRVPTRTDLDAPLFVGPILFGTGWGLVGLCPGPAIAVLFIAPQSTVLFFLCMLLGMFIARSYLTQSLTRPAPN